jgi:hypothetical protein
MMLVNYWYTEKKTLLESTNKNLLDQFQVINYLNQANITWINKPLLVSSNICQEIFITWF